MKPRKLPPWAIALVLLCAAALYAKRLRGCDGRSFAPHTEAGADAILAAFEQRRSDVWVEAEGRIVHLLPDDRLPPRHQLFLVEYKPGHTVKISHNVDLAPKVPVRKGAGIAFRGKYEWNAKGGVVHWTHHDPQGRRPGGHLVYEGKTYK